jgi:hypothetical protein
MSDPLAPTFRGGRNLALKPPPQRYEAGVAFYRDVLGLPLLAAGDGTCTFEFGPLRLHLDRVPRLSQAEVWLEVVTGDTQAAAQHLAACGVVRCDAIEPLPERFDGFWICTPADVIHLVAGEAID